MSNVNDGGRSTKQNLTYDPKTGQWVLSTSTSTSNGLGTTPSTSDNSNDVKIPPTQKTGDYSSSADAVFADSNSDYVEMEYNILTGEMELTPTTKSIGIKVNDTVEVFGLGKYLSGLYFVSSVTRTINESKGYSQSIVLIRNGFGKSVKKSSSSSSSSSLQSNRALEVPKNAGAFNVGDSVKIVGDDAIYSNAHNGVKVPSWVKKKSLTIHQLSDDGTRARLMPINSWTYTKYLQKV